MYILLLIEIYKVNNLNSFSVRLIAFDLLGQTNELRFRY